MMFLTRPIWMMGLDGSASYEVRMEAVVTIDGDVAYVAPVLDVINMTQEVQDVINKHVSRDPVWPIYGIPGKFVMVGDPWVLKGAFNQCVPHERLRKWITRLLDRGELVTEVQHILATTMQSVMTVLSSTPHERQAAVEIRYGMFPVWRKRPSMSPLLWDSSHIRDQAVDLIGALVKVREIRCSWDEATP